MASGVSAAVSYLDFLGMLAKLGANLAPAIALIKGAVADFQEGYAKLQKLGELLGIKPAVPAAGSGPVALTACSSVDGIEITAEVLEAENKLLALSRQHGVHASKLGDGTLLRHVWQFAHQHPELMTTIARLLMGIGGVAAA